MLKLAGYSLMLLTSQLVTSFNPYQGLKLIAILFECESLKAKSSFNPYQGLKLIAILLRRGLTQDEILSIPTKD
tara:strand:- start:242 stop:463 length:222 start_codon:yes stop_codon:yes gene_type:complete